MGASVGKWTLLVSWPDSLLQPPAVWDHETWRTSQLPKKRREEGLAYQAQLLLPNPLGISVTLYLLRSAKCMRAWGEVRNVTLVVLPPHS